MSLSVATRLSKGSDVVADRIAGGCGLSRRSRCRDSPDFVGNHPRQATLLPSDVAADALDELVEVLLHHWMRPRRAHLVAPPLRLRAADALLDVTVLATDDAVP